ncbi:RES family NAD+ phosphorylase [Cupriavidus basilensis]
MAYTSTNIALACSETVVHLIDDGLPLNRYLVQIEEPDEVWDMRLTLKPAVGWDAEPAGKVSLDARGRVACLGERAHCWWSCRSSSREETNVLINPNHPDARKIKATKIRKWLYDARL